MRFIFVHTILFLIAIYLLSIVWKFLTKDENQYFTVQTASGKIRGKQNRTLLDGKLFYSFRGIPFAKPPVDELRFKAPQYVDPWIDTLDAFEFEKKCFEHISADYFEGYEDCLYLDVYVPTNSTTIDPNAKLPVMFYIYGGRFAFGSSNYYAPDFLMEENIIVVISNYRKGPLGFLSLNLPEYSGNMGLKDQAMALKWTYDNIDYFGGDRNQITVCGHSAGAEAAHMQVLSPLSNHLFKRAIILDASAISPELSQDSDLMSTVHNLASELNYSMVNDHEIVSFLKEVDAELLLQKTYQPMARPGNAKSISHGWTVVVEDENAIDPFLTESPFDIMTKPNFKSDIDVLFNVVPLEVALYYEQFQPERLRIFDEMFEFDLPLPQSFIDFKSETYKEIAKRVRDIYFDGKTITAENLDRAHLLMSDIFVTYGIDLSARLHAKNRNARTYFSNFTASTDFSLSSRQNHASKRNSLCAGHADVVYYLHWFSFEGPDEIYFNLKTNPLARTIVKRVANFFANFVKFGSVVPNQETVEYYSPQSKQFKYYDISNDGITIKVQDAFQRERFDGWDEILNEFKSHWNISFDFHSLK